MLLISSYAEVLLHQWFIEVCFTFYKENDIFTYFIF